MVSCIQLHLFKEQFSMKEKSIEAKLQHIQKQKQLLQRKKHEIKKKKLNGGELRKERTKRLIETGAIFEKYFECHSVEEAEQIANQFGEWIKNKKSFEKIMSYKNIEKKNKKIKSGGE
jgi:hypothetical protein